ncbi:hypothetical protein ACIP2X_10595 [Streptomyces sp. NPDC089424]|uniref:hypothetical protein n=1 Tax=Streptomyces sp. NPDC089424 TaxID=3365917 RepID=UPI00380E347A
MITRRTRTASAVASLAAALLALSAGSPSAAALGSPSAALHTGPRLTGTEIPVDLGDVGTCHNLTQAVRSGVNVSAHDIDVFYQPDCRAGLPGSNGDIFYRLGSLHTGEFGFGAVSYRVQPAH